MAYGNTRLARVLLWSSAYVNVALLCMLCSLSSMGAGWLWSLVLVDGSVAWYAVRQVLARELIQKSGNADEHLVSRQEEQQTMYLRGYRAE